MFHPKANSLNSMRFLLATLVAVVHASVILTGDQPHLGATEVGALAVDAFFVLSGFLVAMSYDRLGSFTRYAWHRLLRIMPLFWVVLVLTAFVVAPLIAVLEGRPAVSAITGPDPSWRYVVENAFLYIAPENFGVAGLPTGTGTPGVVNGALWTLFYEATCYVLVAVVGALGLLRRHRWVLVAGVVAVALVTVATKIGALTPPGELFLRFFLVFGLGVLAHAFADRLPITTFGAVLSVVILGVSLAFLTDYRALGAVPFAYLCMWAVVRTPFLRRSLPWDLSYGMYVFHWPVETLLVVSGVAGVLGLVGYTVLAVLVVAALACCSWNLVEKPALAHKNIPLPFDGGRRRPTCLPAGVRRRPVLPRQWGTADRADASRRDVRTVRDLDTPP